MEEEQKQKEEREIREFKVFFLFNFVRFTKSYYKVYGTKERIRKKKKKRCYIYSSTLSQSLMQKELYTLCSI